MKKFEPHKKPVQKQYILQRGSDKKERKLITRQRVKRIILRLIVLCIIILFFTFFYTRYVFLYSHGIVRGEEFYYSAPMDGTVQDIPVQVFEHVSPGRRLLTIKCEDLERKKIRLVREISELEAALALKKNQEGTLNLDRQIIDLKNEITGLGHELAELMKARESRNEQAHAARQTWERTLHLVSLEAATRSQAEKKHDALKTAEYNLAEINAEIARKESELNKKREEIPLLETQREKILASHPAEYSQIAIELQARKAELEEVSQRAAETDIVATAGGTIEDILTQRDSYVLRGAHLLKVIRTDRVYIQAYIKPKQFKKLQVGQSAMIITPDHSVYGKIVEISNKMEPLPLIFRNPFRIRTNFGKVKIIPIETDYPEELLKPGLQVQVRFIRIFS